MFGIFRSLETNSALQKLVMDDVGVIDQFLVEALADGLRSNSGLRSLSLLECDLIGHDEHLGVLADALVHNSTLTSLTLDGELWDEVSEDESKDDNFSKISRIVIRNHNRVQQAMTVVSLMLAATGEHNHLLTRRTRI